MTSFQIQKFEDSAKENGVRYWDAREFMSSLGYDTWTAFNKVIVKSMASCSQLGIDIHDVFIPVQSIEGFNTYKLTRFACFLVSMHADTKKPQVAQAKVVLAALADELIRERIQEGSLDRIEIREELKAGETIMSGAAKAAGLESSQYGVFKNAGFMGMYNMSLKKLIRYKGAPEEKTLYDYMGKTEMAANLFRVTQTAERLKRTQPQGLNQASQTAQDVGREVRDVMIRSSGQLPEDLPIEENISHVKKRLKSANKEMKKIDGKPKKRLPKPS
ncbi:MAG: BRO family protein [Nitrosospira sp.]